MYGSRPFRKITCKHCSANKRSNTQKGYPYDNNSIKISMMAIKDQNKSEKPAYVTKLVYEDEDDEINENNKIDFKTEQKEGK